MRDAVLHLLLLSLWGGAAARNAQVRVVRDGIIVADDKVASLRRFKDDVREVADGYDCGITLEKFSDIKQGDILEAYEMDAQPESHGTHLRRARGSPLRGAEPRRGTHGWRHLGGGAPQGARHRREQRPRR